MIKNQPDVSAASSAESEEAIAFEYISGYMSAVDSVPHDAIRAVSGMRQCSADVGVMLGQLDHLLEDGAPMDELLRVLMTMQERQDEKLRLLQEQILDPVEKRRRNLDKTGRSYRISSGLGPVVVNEKPVGKRVRRSMRGDGAGGPGTSSDVQNDAADQPGPSKPNRRSVGAAGHRGHSAGLRRKVGQRRTPRGGGAGAAGGDNSGSSGSAVRESGVTTRGSKAGSPEDTPETGAGGGNPGPIDPDEPTYCLCEQVSFGEMIGCDNDLCPIEWFHFQCVSLVNKPKGKWYCPRCRGDKPTNMKPRSVFLRELELYNQEKEERADKNAKRQVQQQPQS